MKAVIFPGQGSQYVGMGQSLYHNFPCARRIFDFIDDILGWRLSQLCFYGPQDKLKPTSFQQLAILSVSLAGYEAFREKNIKIDFLSGLSIGECSSLYPAGVLNLKDLVYLVKMRAEAMEEASRANPSCMFAVIGLEREFLEAKSKEGGFYISNINSPNQIVISLRKEDRERIKNNLQELGARVIELPVSGGFHSLFMDSAKKRFRKLVASIEFKKAQIPIVSNVTGRPHTEEKEIRDNIVEQLTSSVLWYDCVEFMVKNGVDVFFEIGPSQILSRLIKKISSQVEVINIEKKEDLDRLS